MDNFYRENILDHYRNPRNFGKMEKPDISFEEENITCGDRIRIELKLTTNNQQLTTIKDIKFHGEGCAVSMASASMLTEKVKNMNITEVKKIGSADIISLLQIDLTPSRLKCALLPLETLHKAISSK